MRILRALPEWFGVEQSILDYVAAAPTLDTWTVRGEDAAVGFLSVKRHFVHAAEVHVMGVLPAHQRKGLGTSLLAAAEGHLRRDGVHLLQVKTLSPAVEYEPYARTRAFYEARGFEAVEDSSQLWDEANPCRLYLKSLLL